MNVSPRQNPAYRLSRHALKSLWTSRWWLALLAVAGFISALSHASLAPGVFPARSGLDKLLHAGEFAVFAFVAWRAFDRSARLALLVSLLFASADELHQSFVPTRHASLYDGLADAVGATLSLLILHWYPALWRFIRARILGPADTTGRS